MKQFTIKTAAEKLGVNVSNLMLIILCEGGLEYLGADSDYRYKVLDHRHFWQSPINGVVYMKDYGFKHYEPLVCKNKGFFHALISNFKQLFKV